MKPFIHNISIFFIQSNLYRSKISNLTVQRISSHILGKEEGKEENKSNARQSYPYTIEKESQGINRLKESYTCTLH